QVVAGGEVGEPLVADADHPAVDLVDDGVDHRVGALELGEIRARVQPPAHPVVGRPTPVLTGTHRSHEPRYRLRETPAYHPEGVDAPRRGRCAVPPRRAG